MIVSVVNRAPNLVSGVELERVVSAVNRQAREHAAPRLGVDAAAVSDFVLPLWFTEEAERGGRNEHLAVRRDGRLLGSFTAAPGGYLGYWDPRTGRHETWVAPGDARAKARLLARERFATAR